MICRSSLRRQGVWLDLSARLQTLGYACIRNQCIILLTHFSPYYPCNSVFGEDALVNVSVEKKDDNQGKLAGYIRIRSKTQGIALSLGDRITSVQRGFSESGKQ